MVCHQAVSVNPAIELPFELNEIFSTIIIVVIGNKNCLADYAPAAQYDVEYEEELF